MRYLFERLRDPARPAAELDTRDAVRDQVQRLAWTAAAGEGDPSANVVPFGLPGVAAIGATLKVEQYAEVFKRLVERHEPRLGAVEVSLRAVADPLAPYELTVSGVLTLSEGAEAVSFALRLPAAR